VRSERGLCGGDGEEEEALVGRPPIEGRKNIYLLRGLEGEG